MAIKLVESYCESEAPASPVKENKIISDIAVPTEQEPIPAWLSALSEHEVTESPATELPVWWKGLPEREVTEQSAVEPPDWLISPRESDSIKWYIGMSDDFIKSIQRIDKKLMGRILEAMTYICKAPITPRGDTIKPLTSELKGLWRYRIGDFRLVYQPEATKKCVTLLLFDNRGTVYQ